MVVRPLGELQDAHVAELHRDLSGGARGDTGLIANDDPADPVLGEVPLPEPQRAGDRLDLRVVVLPEQMLEVHVGFADRAQSGRPIPSLELDELVLVDRRPAVDLAEKIGRQPELRVGGMHLGQV